MRTAPLHGDGSPQDQIVNNKFQVPFGMGSSGNGGRFGGSASLKEFTQTQWVSVMEAPIKYPF